jgi:uncharacterized protein YjiS (DUF1127 family)
MTIDHPKTEKRTFGDHKGLRAVFPAMAEADHAMAYAKDAFERLTGYPAEERHVRGAGTGAAGAMVYAEDIFARVRDDRPNHPYDFDYHLHRHPARDGDVAEGSGLPNTQAERAMIYAENMFWRLQGREPLGAERPQDEVRQHWPQHPSQPGGGPRNDARRHPRAASTAKTASSWLNGFVMLATGIARAMMRLALLIHRSVLEPYARRRRRRIAIAQLKALDNRLLADIGVRRNDIERIVDRLLASRDNVMPAPIKERRRDRRLAA